MQWYSVRDIMEAYSLSRDQLRHLIDTGKLKTEKLFMGKSRTRNFKYIIPETELSKLTEHKLREPQASENAQPDYYEKRAQEKREREERWQEEAQRLAEERRKFTSYYDYLRSDEWQRKRRARLKHDGYRCQMCGSGKQVEVHHICYDHLRKGAEIDDLVTLCHDCHRKVHEYDMKQKVYEVPMPEAKQHNTLLRIAVKLLRENEIPTAFERFNEEQVVRAPDLPESECSQIWLGALRVVYPI